MNRERRVTVEAQDVGQRLDQFLAHKLGVSRSSVQRLIRQGNVVMEGKPSVAHDRVQLHDQMTVIVPPAAPTPTVSAPTPTVLAATEDCIVLNKPAGLLVHAVAGKHEPTLVDWLTAAYPEIRIVGNLERPGIVHRLDRFVSGVIVVARTPAMFAHLTAQFKEHQVLKRYTALVYGQPRADEGTLRFAIRRSARHPARMAARPASAEGKAAVTTFVVVERFRTTTLLSVRILTGRTHQIRAHLFAAGHPVVGDHLYRQKKPANVPELDRLFLHATTLGFTDRSGAWQEFTVPMPDELQQYLALLRRQ